MIVIYPNSPEYGLWSCEDSDVQYIYDLIQHICKKYTIDKERIYMQGMSNGDMMTLAFSMTVPKHLSTVYRFSVSHSLNLPFNNRSIFSMII